MPVFQTYSATVNLKLSNNNQVRKTGLTAPEIALLRAVHGGEDAVHAISHTGAVNVEDKALRATLDRRYGKARSALNKEQTRVSLNDVVGPPGVSLPRELEGVEHDKTIKPAKPTMPLYKLAKDKKEAARAEMRKALEAEAEKRAADAGILG